MWYEQGSTTQYHDISMILSDDITCGTYSLGSGMPFDGVLGLDPRFEGKNEMSFLESIKNVTSIQI